MTSALSWLDSSSASRRQALEVIKLFEEKGTVDEIGIGSVRDALSDSLFPGTSVLQTRARYLFFIPWIYQYLEARRTESSVVAKEARRLEISLIEPLLAADDNAGTIGRVARHRLKVLPSMAYWSGLYAWGLKPTDESQDHYHRSLDRFYRRRDTDRPDDDGQALDGPPRRNWHAGLPPAPGGFPKCSLSFQLTRPEAEYLRERVLTRCRGTLLAHLVDICRPAEVLFAWEHPEAGGFPAIIKGVLGHARNFSETIYGAALLYNLMLAEQAEQSGRMEADQWVQDYREAFGQWVSMMKERSAPLARWNRGEFWELVSRVNPRIPLPTRTFVNAWLDLAMAGNPAALRDFAPTRHLISDRERAIKGRLARLHSKEALSRWHGASGAAQLSYRWYPQVQRIVTDIQTGLGRHA
jgi:hypothetical protein